MSGLPLQAVLLKDYKALSIIIITCLLYCCHYLLRELLCDVEALGSSSAALVRMFASKFLAAGSFH